MAAFPLALLRCCFVRPSSKSEANCRKAERARFMVRRGRSLCFGVSSLYSSSNLNGSHSVGRSCGLPLSGMCLPSIRPPFTDKQKRCSPRASPFCRAFCSRSAFGSEKACSVLGIKKDGETVHVSPSPSRAKGFGV